MSFMYVQYVTSLIIAAWDTQSLDLIVLKIKTNFKKVKTLENSEKCPLQNGGFTFLKFVFILKLSQSN